MPEQDRPHKPLGPDAKERFFWRMGERPAKTEFASLNAEVRNASHIIQLIKLIL
jgi:hypothetical protein